MAEERLHEGFTMAERDRRWSLLRTLMAEHEVDFLLVFPQWMGGDSQFVANHTRGTVVFPSDGEPVFISRRPTRTAPDAWIQNVRAATTSGTTAAPYGGPAGELLADLGADGKRVATAGLRGGGYYMVRNPDGYVPYTSLDDVKAAVPGAEFVDGSAILAEARYVKSDEEIEVLRTSVQIAEASAAAVAETARPGALIADVFAAGMAAQHRGGAGPAHLAWGGAPWGQPINRAVGPVGGTVEDGWAIKTEIEPAVLGYTCQVTQPIFVGPPPDEALELFDLGRRAFERACEVMRPGATWREVYQAVEAVADSSSPYRTEFLTHGRGLGDEGPMFIPTDDHADNPLVDDPLRANTVHILKPYAYRADGRRDDWSNGHNVTWGDSVVVRPGGAERLGTRPNELGKAG